MAEEVTFFQQGNATVTSARVILNGTTYALRNVTSVQMRSRGPKLMWPILIAAVSALVAVSTLVNGKFDVFAVAAAICAFFIWMIVSAKTTYVVGMATAGGEVDALSSTDKASIKPIVAAINDAMVHKS